MPLEHLTKDPVLFILLLASLASWMIIIDRLLAFRRIVRADYACREGGGNASSPLAALLHEMQRHAGLDREHLLIIMDAAVTLQRQRLERLLPLLGVIGSTAPYLGLLGTVIGIIQAFMSIQAQNNMSPSVVAGGIATALVATATGLAVAIPAVAAHHLLTAAITRHVSYWEARLAEWLPTEAGKGVGDEPYALAQSRH